MVKVRYLSGYLLNSLILFLKTNSCVFHGSCACFVDRFHYCYYYYYYYYYYLPWVRGSQGAYHILWLPVFPCRLFVGSWHLPVSGPMSFTARTHSIIVLLFLPTLLLKGVFTNCCLQDVKIIHCPIIFTSNWYQISGIGGVLTPPTIHMARQLDPGNPDNLHSLLHTNSAVPCSLSVKTYSVVDVKLVNTSATLLSTVDLAPTSPP